ncbi:hypothetical protein FNU76_23280 [Chitinimonas arctica]|uniref:Uncharacterized protein n=1 Tax=Chitinimonas arctica TaxID=2594795 RepID=A0A516SLK0_9NEIS|nr:hypothetical protein [Chitinimonas arctica]QDQ29034.1 hypothetical protein FNU76_23280 [Chitinimonas arctica]
MRRLAALSLLCCPLLPLASECPEFAAPPEARLSLVAQRMLINGVPMAVMQIDSPQAPAALLAHYRRVWSAGGEVTEYPVGAWQAIATARAHCFYTFQVKPAGRGASGFLSISDADNGSVRQPSAFPMPGGSQLINDIQHEDAIRNGRTVFLSNALTMESNAIFYRNNLMAQGWNIATERRLNTKRGPGIVFDLQRPPNLAMLTISRSEGRTYVLFNYMDKP